MTSATQKSNVLRSEKIHDYLKVKDLLPVPFDKGNGFCVMKSMYRENLKAVQNSDQFQKIDGVKDEIVNNTETEINKSLQQLRKLGKIREKNLSKCWSWAR